MKKLLLSLAILASTATIVIAKNWFGSKTTTNLNSVEIAAENGDAEAIYQLVVNALDREDVAGATKLITRLKIRIYQDSQCSTDPSTQAAADMITALGMSDNAIHQQTLQAINNISTDDYQKIILEQIDWAQNLINQKKLPKPYWIAKYGMHVSFMGQKLEETFIPQAQWQPTRQAILDKSRTGINARKQS